MIYFYFSAMRVQQRAVTLVERFRMLLGVTQASGCEYPCIAPS